MINHKNIIEKLRIDLKNNINEKTLNTAQNFFKEKIHTYGVKVPDVNKISKSTFKLVKDFSKQEIYNLCEELWKSGYFEESIIAGNWSYYINYTYQIEDIKVFEKWLDLYVTNWASCDNLCNHTVGMFLEMYPECVSILKKWTQSNNRWMRRGAAVSLIIPARKGMFLNDIFDIANNLINDKDDLVKKGYGWMLKAASEYEYNIDKVFNFIMLKKDVMPRTALRYAIEKMPDELKKLAMNKPVKNNISNSFT